MQGTTIAQQARLDADLQSAARSGDHAAVARLLAAGADPDARCAAAGPELGHAPVHLAAAAGHAAVIEALVAGTKATRGDGDGDGDGIGVRVAVDSRTSSSFQTALHLACKRGHVGAAATLLRLGASPNAHDHAGTTPLMKAAAGPRQGRLAEAGLAAVAEGWGAAAGGPPAAPAAQAAAAAAAAAQPAAQPAAAAAAGQPGQDGAEAEADRLADRARSELVRLLLDAGADASACNSYSMTALHFAARAAAPGAAAALLERGADAAMAAKYGRTPLLALATGGAGRRVRDADAVAELLVRHGAIRGGGGGGGGGVGGGDADGGGSDSGGGGDGDGGGAAAREPTAATTTTLEDAAGGCDDVTQLTAAMRASFGPNGCPAAAAALRNAAMARAFGGGGGSRRSALAGSAAAPESTAAASAAAAAAAAANALLPDDGEGMDGAAAARLLALVKQARASRRALAGEAARLASEAARLSEVTHVHQAILVGAAAALRSGDGEEEESNLP